MRQVRNVRGLNGVVSLHSRCVMPGYSAVELRIVVGEVMGDVQSGWFVREDAGQGESDSPSLNLGELDLLLYMRQALVGNDASAMDC